MPPRWSWEAQKCRRTWGVTTSGQSGRCVVAALARAARKGLVTDPGRRRVAVLPLGWQQRDAGPSVVVTEVTPPVLDEPPQRLAPVVDQRDHPFPAPGTTSALAMTDVQLAESAQVPLDVGQVEFAHLVDPQPDLGHQPAGGVVAGGRRELPAGRQLFAPPGEQVVHLAGGGRDPQLGLVVLADVSLSVRNTARFTLHLVHGLQSLFSRVRTFVFVADLTEVTECFTEHPIEDALGLVFGGALFDVDG